MTIQRTNLRSRVSFAPQKVISIDGQMGTDVPLTNVILKSQVPENAWINEATARIGDWRSLVRSVYLRWAITINACVLAKERYEQMPAAKALQTKSIRVTDGVPELTVIAQWSGGEAARNYSQTTALLAAHGVVEIYGAFEDIIFDLYRIVLQHNPAPIIEGPEFRNLRRLWRTRLESDEALIAWETAWERRYEKWRRKRAYDGLHTVFTALFKHAGLVRPSSYQLTDVEDWSRWIEMLGELRNLIVHGSPAVSQRLADLSTETLAGFHAGDELDVDLTHLQAAECFFDQLLSAINISLIEGAMPTGPAVPTAPAPARG